MDVDQDSAGSAAVATAAASPRGQQQPLAHQGAEATVSPSRPPQLAAVQEEEALDASTNGHSVSASQQADTAMSEQADNALSPNSIAANNEQKQVAATLAGLASNSTSAAPSPVGPNPAPLPPGYNKDQPICANCATQTTPLWRRSHDSAHILCNACALFFKMKGRPRPISLKTDVIKSRNRSKSKSTSKDRSKTKDRVEGRAGSTRSSKDTEAGEDTEMADVPARDSPEAAAEPEEGTARRVRKMPPPGYGFMPLPGYPSPYPYPYYGHYAPYPLPAARSVSRSRSSDPNRRAQSLDARAGPSDPRRPPTTSAPNPYTPPAYNPGQPALDVSSYYPPYPYPPGYAPMPYYPGAPGMPAMPNAAAISQSGASGTSSPGGYSPAHPGLSQALQRPATGSTPVRSQSHSRSRSPNAAAAAMTDSRPNSNRASPEPAAPTMPQGMPAPYWPHPNPNMHHMPYAHSPLSAAHRMQVAAGLPGLHRGPAVGRASGTATPPEIAMAEAAHRAALAYSSKAAAGLNGESANSSSHSSSNETVQPSSARSTTITDSALFGSGSTTSTTPAAAAVSRHHRDASVSSTSASERSEDGLRSPESTVQRSEERRGRPERRYDDVATSHVINDAFEDIDEEVEVDLPRSSSLSETGRRMKRVESGFGDLRVQDQRTSAGSPLGRVTTSDTSQSRSRSSGQERGRSRGPPGANRSGSQTRATRGLSSTDNRSTSSGRYSTAAEAEIARLRSKVAELTFLNGLMQSRLAQLDKSGSVPKHVVTSLTAETPRPFEEDADDDTAPTFAATEGAALEHQFGAMAHDPATRTAFLEFLKARGGDVDGSRA
ncbi:GATA zinc finger protein 3 [Microbotryomycetes sp. JL201]|nr:GATA zinc finger protein 3 [Microbotryomycetes sp. JL201]